MEIHEKCFFFNFMLKWLKLVDVISPNKKMYHSVAHLLRLREDRGASVCFSLSFDKCAKSAIGPSQHSIQGHGNHSGY